MRTTLRLTFILIIASAVTVQAEVVPATLQIVDDNQNVLGTTSAGRFTVALLVNDRTIIVDVYKTYLRSTYGSPVYFENADCTGQAYVVYIADSFLDPQAVIGPENRVYHSSSHTPQACPFTSMRIAGQPCSAGFGTLTEGIPVDELVDLSSMFTPPFSLQALPAQQAAAVPGFTPLGISVLAILLAATGAVLIVRRSAA